MHLDSISLNFFLTFLSLLSHPLLTLSTPVPVPLSTHQPPCGSCLVPTELAPLATKWLSLFSSGGISNPNALPAITTKGIQYWNEDFTYPGCPTPYANGQAELQQVIGGSAKNWTTCRDISFEVVSVWGGCDRMAVRWRQRAVVSGQDSRAKAKTGAPVLFSGIDLLTVDLATRQISNAETSSDRVSYYAQVGVDPFAND